MKESKYYYNGISLTKYCRENDINISTVHARIWKLRQNSKYDKLSLQEIINKVIEGYKTTIKYTYKGISLRTYCEENNLNYGTITSRIKKLKQERKDISIDEAVRLAIEEYENKNYRFYYQGEALVDYCKKHQELNYKTLISYIKRELDKNKDSNIEKIIESYINKEHKGKYKYYYCGIPLIDYCKENNLVYKNIISVIARAKTRKENKDLSNDELIEKIMDSYSPFKPKYMYKGKTLSEYCKEHNLSYYSVVSYVKRRLKKISNSNIDDLIDEGIKTINRYGIIYYYKGVPLIDYCRENNLNASSIRCQIIRHKKDGRPLQDIIDECVETYQKFERKYFYNGQPLTEFCKKIGLSYATIIEKYHEKYEGNENISVEGAIQEIVDDYLLNPPIRTKYFFGEASLSSFCKEKGYSYTALYQRIKNLERKDELTREEIINISIEKYEKKLEIEKINNIFKELKNDNINPSRVREICTYLKISYGNVEDLLKMGFRYNQAVNLIWYFTDREDINNNKIITDRKLEEVFKLIEEIKNGDNNKSLYNLIGIYKSELLDTRENILKRQNKYINKIIYTLSSEYNIKVNSSNYEDFKSELEISLILLIDKTSLNNEGQIIRYMDLTLKGYFRSYLRKVKETTYTMSLDDTRYSKDKDNPKAKKLIDTISKGAEEETDNSFSSNMQKALANLDSDEIKFIILRFQEDYSYEELSNYYKKTIEEIKQEEISILSKLRDNENIKKLIKEKHNN